MKMIWMLAAAATLAACHNKSEETGAAPDRGDHTDEVLREFGFADAQIGGLRSRGVI